MGIYHQTAPGLHVGWAGEELHAIGSTTEAQLCTKLNFYQPQEPLFTAPVRRGEGEFPLDLPGVEQSVGMEQPEPEKMPAAEELKLLAEQKRLRGNEMFRANDFLQAALQYTEALAADPTMSSCLANRAQCWLKAGDHEKAFADSVKCTEMDPTNAKGWFRKGMSLHAMEQYTEAIPAFLEAEKLDTRNTQIPEAIKMAQLMARKQA